MVVSGDDTLLRTPSDLDEELFQEIINKSGLKCDPIVGTGTGLFSFGGVKGAHLLRRHFMPDYTTQ